MESFKFGVIYLMVLLSWVPLDAACLSGRHSNGLTAFALSPDGTKIAAAAADGTVLLWDVANGRRTTLVNCLVASVISFSPDSSQLAVADADGAIELFRTASGKLIQKLHANGDLSHTGSIDELTFSADGSRLAVHDLNGDRVWSVDGGRELVSISNERMVEKIALNREGTLLARGGYGSLTLWEISRDKPLKNISLQPDDDVEAIAFAHDDRWLAAALSGNRIVVWDVQTGEKVEALQGSAGHVNSFIVPASVSLVSAEDSGSVRMWNLNTGELESTSQAARGIVKTDGKLVLKSTVQMGELKLWRIGQPAYEARSFHYESDLCATANAERNEAKSEQTDLLDLVEMGESRAKDGTHLSFSSYVTRHCETVTITHGDFQSPSGAEEELNLQVNRADEVIEQGSNKDFFGKNVGQKAVLVVAKSNGVPAVMAILWTEGNHYSEIVSSSLQLARSLEKRYRR